MGLKGMKLSSDPRWNAQRRYHIVSLCSTAVNAMRRLEDYARLDLKDEELADRAREVHELITARIYNGRRVK